MNDVVLINLTEFKVALKGKRIRNVITLNDLIARGYRQFFNDFMRLCRGNESLSVSLMTILSTQVFRKRNYSTFTRVFAHSLLVLMKSESCRHGESRNAAGVPNIFQAVNIRFKVSMKFPAVKSAWLSIFLFFSRVKTLKLGSMAFL